jgi:hypothetical protein
MQAALLFGGCVAIGAVTGKFIRNRAWSITVYLVVWLAWTAIVLGWQP